jgi:hypothetical protein
MLKRCDEIFSREKKTYSECSKPYIILFVRQTKLAAIYLLKPAKSEKAKQRKNLTSEFQAVKSN